jgi:Cellulose binding domain
MHRGDPEKAVEQRAPGAGQEPWRRPRPFSRPMWYPVAGASAALALLAGGGMTLLTLSRGPAGRPVADGCGLVACGASLPAAVTGAAPPGTAVRSTAPAPRRRHAARPPLAPPMVVKRGGARAPGHSRRPHPQQTSPAPPAPAPPPASPVTVTYTLDDGGPWHPDFRAHLTIVNNGRSPVSGWTIQVSLPGDQVSWVSSPGGWGPFEDWRFTGGTLVLNAVAGGEALAPGATEIVPIFGQGATTAPGSCTFDGSACQP